MSNINVAIVEDEALFRSMLAGALERCQGIHVVGSYGDAEELLADAPLAKIDVALLDIDLGRGMMDGIDLGLKLRQHYGGIGILLLSNHPHLTFARELIDSNFVGWAYLLKKSVQKLDTIRRTLDGVHRGEVVLDPQLMNAGLASILGEHLHLTPRQLELWQLITQGYSNAAIARRLGLSTKWIDNAVGSLYRALDIDTQDLNINARVAAAQAYARATQSAHLAMTVPGSAPGGMRADRSSPR